MNTDLMLDITELALTKLSNNSTVCFVHIDDIYRDMLAGKSVCKTKATKGEVKNILKRMFPIYKNKKKDTILFKISSKSAYRTCRAMHMRLRPLADIVGKSENADAN